MIGRDTGPAGRTFRLFIGLTGIALLNHRLRTDGVTLAYVGQMALFALLLTGGYAAAWRLLGRRFIERVSPWVTSALLLLPIVAYSTNRGGSPFFDAVALYMSLSLLTNAVSGYGGAEPAAVPVVIWRTRYPTYSPFNTVDLMERAFRERRPGRASAVLSSASMIVAAFVFLMFWVAPILAYVPPFTAAPIRLPGVLALVLLLPAALFAYAAVSRRDRTQGIAAVTAALLAPVFFLMSEQGAGPQGILWGLIVVTGLVVGLIALIKVPLRRHRTPLTDRVEPPARPTAEGSS